MTERPVGRRPAGLGGVQDAAAADPHHDVDAGVAMGSHRLVHERW
jgi:hypothetical protein